MTLKSHYGEIWDAAEFGGIIGDNRSAVNDGGGCDPEIVRADQGAGVREMTVKLSVLP